MAEIRTTVLHETAVMPRNFFELLALTRVNYSSLTEVLEALIAEGSLAKTSDGFQTLYKSPKSDKLP
jgi:hypothetical protein